MRLKYFHISLFTWVMMACSAFAGATTACEDYYQGLLAGLGSPRRLNAKTLAAAIRNREIPAIRRHLSTQLINMLKTNVRTKEAKDTHPYVSDWAKLFEASDGIMSYLTPDPHTYGEQSWKWDLIFGAYVVRELERNTLNPKTRKTLDTLSRHAVFAAYENQIQEGANAGMVPHMNFTGGKDEALWLNPHHSSLTQPPLTLAVHGVLNPTDRAALYPAMRAELKWWLRERVGRDGLVYVIHPWETGRDAGRDNDSQMLPYLGGNAKSLQFQTQNTGVKGELWKIARFNLLEKLQATSEPSKLFNLRTPDMMSHLIIGLENLSEIARELGRTDDVKEYKLQITRLKKAMNDRMWDEKSGYYYSVGNSPSEQSLRESPGDPSLFEVQADGKIPVKQASNFLALAAGVPSLQQAKVLLENIQSRDFWTTTPLPTLSTQDPLFNAQEYWRGSSWVNINYLTVKGLSRYAEIARKSGDTVLANEFESTASELAWKTILATQEGFYEYYASTQERGSPGFQQGPKNFLWSALSLNLLEHVKPHVP